MATEPRRGFVPARRYNEDFVRNMQAAASTNQGIAVGDAVTIINGVVSPASAGQDPTYAGYGVVLRCYSTANRPFTQQTVKFIASGGVGRVDVLIDPDMSYIVRCETSVGPSNIGKNVVIDTSAVQPSLGISGQALTIPASASQNDLFKIINLSPYGELSGKDTGGEAGNGVEVKWNRHFLHASTVGQ